MANGKVEIEHQNNIFHKNNVNNDKPRIIAVIQGPVSSTGRTFETTEIGKDKGSIDESKMVILFDSSHVIIEKITELRKHNIDVIYSGWSNDCTPAFRDEMTRSGATVILSDPDKAPSIIEKNSPFKGILSINNKSKQFYSVLQGLYSIPNLSKCIVIKIRSDITLDIQEMLVEISKHEDSLYAGGIILQYLKCNSNSRLPTLWIPDFWFVGRGDVLLHISQDLLHRSLNNDSYSDSPHVDIGNAILRYHWPYFPKLKKDDESLKDIARRFGAISFIREIMHRIARSILKRKIISLYRENLLIPSSRKMQHSISWRGDHYGEFAKNNPEVDNDVLYGKEN